MARVTHPPMCPWIQASALAASPHAGFVVPNGITALPDKATRFINAPRHDKSSLNGSFAEGDATDDSFHRSESWHHRQPKRRSLERGLLLVFVLMGPRGQRGRRCGLFSVSSDSLQEQ